MTNWHADESCVNAGTPLFNTCNTQPGAGSYPARPAYTASTTFTTEPDLPETGLPAAGTSIPATEPARSQALGGLNFAFRSAIQFDGFTSLYAPLSGSNSTSFSLSFWCLSANLGNWQGSLMSSPARTLVDTGGGSPHDAWTLPPVAWEAFSAQYDDGTDEYSILDAANANNGLHTEWTDTTVGGNEWTHVMLNAHSTGGVTKFNLVYDTTTVISNTTFAWGANDGMGNFVAGPITFPFALSSNWYLGGTPWTNWEFGNASLDMTNTAYGTNPGGSRGAAYGFIGCLMEVWFAPGQYVDFTSQTVREKFHTKEDDILGILAPVDLGPTGKLPTGSKPKVYFSGMGTPQQGPTHIFPLNRATGKRWTVIGDLILCDADIPS